MYIKLTRMDGAPIWLNASFIVTIEPHRRSGGSVVVPVGDGLDYEVKESPETVLAMLEGAPAPAIVPVSASDALTATPEDVSPEDDETQVPDDHAQPEKPAKKTTARRAKAKQDKEAGKPAEQSEAPAGKKKPSARNRSKKKPTMEMDAGELDRLRKLAPKSLKKLGNTISTQFKVSNADETIELLKDLGVIELEGERVIWPETETPQS